MGGGAMRGGIAGGGQFGVDALLDEADEAFGGVMGAMHPNCTAPAAFGGMEIWHLGSPAIRSCKLRWNSCQVIPSLPLLKATAKLASIQSDRVSRLLVRDAVDDWPE